jgi:hypothetical protein
MGKNWFNERFIWKKFDGFSRNTYPEVYGGLNLDLFYSYFLERTSKIKSGGFAAMWAHS